MKKNRKWAFAAAAGALLSLAFWYGGGAPGLQGWQAEPAVPDGEASSYHAPDAGPSRPSPPEPPPPDQDAPAHGNPLQGRIPDVSGTHSQLPESVPAQPSDHASPQLPAPSQPPTDPEQSPPPEEGQLTCTFSIQCVSVLDHLDWLDPDKEEVVPPDGVILAGTEVSFSQGDTVFDLLQQLTRAQGIHMEASFTPGYGSSYVEGIANLYEFDCGQQSGWLYLVNGISPGYGSSQYPLSPGDRVEWVYTCQLGGDVGAGVSG